MKAVVLLSGGLDSTTLAYFFKHEGYDVHALAFDYGQRHRKELVVAEQISRQAGFAHDVIRLHRYDGNSITPFATLLPGTALTDRNVPVPRGHYEDESMKATVVPNRNAMMLGIAYSVAMAEGAQVVAFAAHSGDHAIYPDCRPEFVKALDVAFHVGAAWTNDDVAGLPYIGAPFLTQTKGEIAVLAHDLGVPIGDTWSCYVGLGVHCGACGTCVERREALAYARKVTGKDDPTRYAS